MPLGPLDESPASLLRNLFLLVYVILADPWRHLLCVYAHHMFLTFFYLPLQHILCNLSLSRVYAPSSLEVQGSCRSVMRRPLLPRCWQSLNVLREPTDPWTSSATPLGKLKMMKTRCCFAASLLCPFLRASPFLAGV
jgi:hypothetical protein